MNTRVQLSGITLLLMNYDAIMDIFMHYDAIKVQLSGITLLLMNYDAIIDIFMHYDAIKELYTYLMYPFVLEINKKHPTII